MESERIQIKKEFKLKDAITVFTSFSLICLAVIFILTVYEVVTFQDFLSFDQPLNMIMNVIITSLALLLFGVVLTKFTPSNYIDDTNKTYQNYSFFNIFVFMFLGALFEELLFRGIIQNLIFIFIENQWLSIIVTTLLFLAFHIQYFKKPLMLFNISIPSLIFGWVYFETNNILVPIVVHFVMNFGITLFFKYNIISVK
ncbi:lysostaphin resistance A-like protein [Lysinibacillus sp. NPDC096418]|uniref:CPBP family intramembrane glutamic endopeptidase n=1 Tax=Lysinibacillus sp. NPDC096418 TaxID=3364138 RepID=UPI003810E588